MRLCSGNRAVILQGPGIDYARPVIKADRYRNPKRAPEQSEHGRKSWGARAQNKPREQRVSEIEKPLGADRPRNRRATANRVDDRIFANKRVHPSVDRKQEVRKRLQDAAKSLWISGEKSKRPAANGHVYQHHEQKERIEACKPRPQKSPDPAQPLCGHQLPVVVVNHETAQDEKKSHPESGDLTDPENEAPGRFMIGQNPCKPVPDKHGKSRDKT